MTSRSAELAGIDAIYAGKVYDQLNRMGRLYILRAFKETGVLRGSGEQYRALDLKEKMGVVPEYDKLFGVLLIILKNAGFISLVDDGVIVSNSAELGIPEITRAAGDLQREIVRDYPEMADTVASLAKCMDKYAAVLTGKMSHAEALFPNGSMKLVENLYTNNKIQDFFNRLVGQKVGECIARAFAKTPFSEIALLEIGAGTGSTTAHVLHEINGLGNFSYCYTDIASVFTQHGKRKFGADYPFMTFKTLNVEEDVEAQGFERASWDVVIASNVLHATARIGRTLDQVGKLIKPGGILIMNEVTRFQEIVNVIFGLTSGWWLFEDPECRLAHCPSLSFAGWKAGLEKASFIHVRNSGLTHDSQDNPMQCVIVAESNCDGETGSRPVNADCGWTSVAIDNGEPNPSRSGRRERIESEVRGLMYQSSEIEITGPDGDTNLFELGFASLMIARLKDLIKRTYGLDVQMSWFYNRLDTFNKTVGYIDKESDADAEPTPAEAFLPAAAAPRAARIEGDAGGIISRQIELMSQQLTVMSEQLNALRGPMRGKGNHQELLNRQASLITAAHQDRGNDGGRAELRESKPAEKKVEKRDEFVAYRGVTRREKLDLNTRQQAHLKKLIGTYTGLTPGSKERTRKFRPVFANTRNIAGFRPEWKEMIYQIIVERADGSHFTDIDGRDYLDVSMGFGVYLLGHNPSCVQAEVQRELQQGTPIGPMSNRAGKVATLIHELTGVERVAFFNTGTEAVMAAVRIARTVTGRKKVALFSSSYHGHFDGVLAVKNFDGPVGSAVPMSPGTLPEMVQDIYVLDYGTEEALQFIEAHGRELAAVLVEPVQSRRPDFQPAPFLKRLREITTASGSALIFDEVILGFRIHPGGAQAWFDIRADIVTYGKVVGGGMPIGVVAGKSHYLDAVDGGMWQYGDGSFPERENTFIAGTFNHHPLAMAGAHAVLTHLKETGPSLQADLNQRTGELAERLNRYFEGEDLPIRMIHFGSLFRIPVKGDQELLYYHLLSRGIYIWEGRNCFLSTAHTDGDIAYFVKSVQESIEEMRAGGLFGGGGRLIPHSKSAGDHTAIYPMSSAQKRLYVVSRMEGGELAYHINGALIIDGALDREKIEQCFQTIISRHESLRTGFEILDDVLVQRVREHVEFSVSHSDRSLEDIDAIVKDFIRPFDLAKPPLIRVGLVKFSADRHFLIIDAHHIVIDGISLIILAQEFMRIYGGEPLPPVTLSYRDYVAWEQELIVSEGLKKQETYWLGRLSGRLPVLRLPLDYPRPPRQSFEGGVVRFIFERGKTGNLKALAKKTGSTPYMVLFAAFNLLLYRLSGQKDIIIGTSSSGRDHLGFEGIFGMCTNTLVMRNEPEGDKPFILFLDAVKKNCLKAFDNQDYPFELLIKNLNLQRDPGHNPLFDVFFVYEEADNRVVKIKDLTFTPYEYEKRASAFDLLLEVIEEAGQLYLNMEYCAGLFRKETVERFLRYFMAILDQITDNPSTLLRDVVLRSISQETQNQRYGIARRPDRDGLFPLSHHQERLWFVERFESGYLYASSPVYYNMPLMIHITGTPDVAALEKSVNRIIERHEILRTKIVTSNGQAFQAVIPQSLLNLSVVELPALPGQDAIDSLRASALKDITCPFLMDQAPPIRSTLFSFGKEEHLLVITLHHIIADPRSLQIVTKEIAELYNSIITGISPHLPEPGIQFADFAAWEKETSDDLLADKMMNLRRILDGKIQALVLPTDRPRPAIHTYRAGSCPFGLPRELSEQLIALADQEGVKLYSLLLAAFQTLLYRYSGQENIVVGTPAARRDRKETMNGIGPFANPLVIPSDFSGPPAFRDLLSQVERSVIEIFEYRDVPFDRLVLALDPEKDMSRTALFDVMFHLRDSRVPMPAMKGLQTKVMETNLGWGKYDLNLCMEHGPEGLSGIVVYNKDLFDDSTIEGMNKHYRVLLESIAKDPSLSVPELRLLTAEEEQRQIFEWNDTEANYPTHKTIHQLFEEQVENTPDRTAVVIGNVEMTYRELNRKANQLAHYLRKRGLVPDRLVCVCMERSIELIVTLLAILKSGGAYVPLDPSYPKDRLQFMLEDTGLPLVVTQEHVRERLPQCAASLVLIDADRDSISRQSEDNPVNCNSPEHLAYVIYTSGSTGTPKGVLIAHRNVVRLMTNDKFPFDFTENDVWTMFHSYCFDFSVWEMYGALLYGGKLVIVPKETSRDSEKFLSLLKAEKVTILNQTPRSFYNLAGLETSAPGSRLSLRTVIFGGEALKPAMLRAFREKYPGVKLINMYGITETTVHVTYKEITGAQIDANQSNVGRPIPTLTAYVMDKWLRLLPIGVPGELLVGGDGVGRGYLNREALTREKFIDNPHKAGERLYRSGDLVKMLPGGEIEYLGRIDQQVKIRGYRIELGEIENVLLGHPGIDQAAVIDREDAAGDRFLCAYLVTGEDKHTADGRQMADVPWHPVEVETLRSYLGGKLPEYMIPSRFFRIDKMPLTANGKIDTKALLSVEGEGLKHDTGFALPQTENEVLLAGIWKAVLGREEIGVLDNYFALGGDSIKLIQILSRLNQQHLKLEVRHFFETPTIRALAKKLTTISRIPQQGAITGRVPLTAIQSWFFREHAGEWDHYAQAVWLRSKDRVDEKALGLSLEKLQAHHDSLRMIFRFEGESVIQEIAGLEYPLGFTVVDLKERGDADGELNRISAEVPASLHLNRGPMMKTVLFRLDNEDRILIVIHHLAVDGVSWRILIEDLGVCYGQAISGRSPSLPQKTDAYRLWAEKIAGYSQSPKLLEEMSCWRKIEESGALAIPPDFVAASNRYEDMGTVFVALGASETLALMTKANSAYHTEVSDLLLAALARAMKRCCGAGRGFIEMEGHGREPLFDDIDIGRTVGWFTSIYPALVDIPESDEPGMQIKQIKEGLRRIPNRGIGYGILKYLAPLAEGSQIRFNRKARILFNYLGSFDAGGQDGFGIDERNAGNTISGRLERENEIVIEGAVMGGRLKLSLSYNTKAHARETVAQFLRAYQDELLAVIDHCVSRETEELTPHDLTWKDFTLQELDKILSGCGISNANLKDIYPLSPLQEGMLFHARLDAGAGSESAPTAAYFMQISFGIDGQLDPAIFEACWNLLVARHDILRTVFTHKGADRPLQVVARQGTIDFRFEDISALSDGRQLEFLAAFRDRDRKEGFDPMAKAPMRVSVFKKTERSFEVVWSYHHLLIDGWCAGILMSEFFEAYGTLRQGGAPAVKIAAPFGAYIRWVEHLDRQATIDYWRDYLQGYDHPALLPKGTDGAKEFRPETLVLEIGPQTVEGLKRFASGNQVTVNTVIQTAWALVLGRYSGADDVVFGATVSGRPAEVADIENMAGLFINTVPVRIRIDPEKTVARLVRDVQADALKSQPHHYGSLADVQAVTSLKQDLLDHVLVFENYPLADELIGLEQKYPLGFCIGEVKVFEQTNYNLILVVEPGRTMRTEFRYNASVFPASLMEQVKEAFGAIIGSVASGAEITIGELRLFLMSTAEKNERDSFIESAREISEDF